MAPQDSAQIGDSLTEGRLNLIYPGLAQLCQGRRAAAAYSAIEGLGLIVLLVVLPEWRVLTVVGMVVLTGLSILDAVSARGED